MIAAHFGGLPLEEIVGAAAGGAAGLAVARGWIASRLRLRRSA